MRTIQVLLMMYISRLSIDTGNNKTDVLTSLPFSQGGLAFIPVTSYWLYGDVVITFYFKSENLHFHTLRKYDWEVNNFILLTQNQTANLGSGCGTQP